MATSLIHAFPTESHIYFHIKLINPLFANSKICDDSLISNKSMIEFIAITAFVMQPVKVSLIIF